jgi:nucleotide-binding universal stress UspA family protein
MINVQRILYPTDFSSYSTQAYFHALALATTHGASLTIAHVLVPGTPRLDDSNAPPPDRNYWRNQLEQIHPLDVSIPVDHVLLEGDPATQIVQLARDTGADLIVMGTHGRTGTERLLLGSVAEKVMRDSPVSVMVVKLPKGAPIARPLAVAAGSR